MIKLMTQMMQPVRRRAPKRRGVLLLIILGMLAMFGLIGIAFVMLTSHARKSAEVLQKKEFYVAEPKKFTDEAINQILRGSRNRGSVLQNHSLFEDVYGNSYLDPVIINNITSSIPTNGFDDNNDGNADESGETYPGIVNLAPIANNQLWEIAIPEGWRYVGRLLTMTDGPAAGKTTRIVGYDNTSTPPMVWVVPIPDVLIADCQNHILSTTPLTPINFIINGPAFAGTGFGLNVEADPNEPQLAAKYDSWFPTWQTYPDDSVYWSHGSPSDPLLSLLPNPTTFQYDDVTNPGYDYADALSGPGGANEEYDAIDYQNMLLALQLVDGPDNGNVAAPSLHRPALLNYWVNELQNIVNLPTGVTLSDKQAAFGCPILYASGPDGILGNGDDLILFDDLKVLFNFKRQVELRPIAAYHPNFTGSNPNYWPLWDGDPTSGPIQYDFDGDMIYEVDIVQPEWDVDNDGDAIKDSIWVDIGLPVQTTKDGVKYKPLVAIHCVDLDGRLNLNAHGCLAQIMTDFDKCDDANVAPMLVSTKTIISPGIKINRGQGWGTAEIDLRALLGGNYGNVLKGAGNVPGRYGFDKRPGGMSSTEDLGATVDVSINSDSENQRLPEGGSASRKYTLFGRPHDFAGYPSDYLGITTFDGGTIEFGSPVGLKGGMSVFLDWRGQPVYQTNTSKSAQLASPNHWLDPTNPENDYSALVGHPYELDLSLGALRGSSMNSSDAPFSPAELERILRPYDIDTANLPNRLQTLSGLSANKRRQVTTDSWDIVSTPNAVTAQTLETLQTALETEFGGTVPEKFQDPIDATKVDKPRVKEWLDQFPVGLPQLLVVQLSDKGMTYTDIEANFETIGKNLLGPELMAGLPLNLNRRFSPRIAANPAQNRQERRDMARHLYCIAMLLADLDALDNIAWQTFIEQVDVPLAASVGSSFSATEKRQYSARLLAQWAINVVDFRCNDSAMTGFEFDLEPFEDNNSAVPKTTWDLDNYIDSELDADDNAVASADDTTLSERKLVWGCARPELLITETFALHDRRTEDTAVADGLYGEGSSDDEDYDQRWHPEGSLFVELYNPWAANESLPLDLSSGGGLDLTKTATTDGTTSPVWRMAITESLGPVPTKTDLNAPLPSLKPDITRAVYFVDPSGSATIPLEGDAKFQPTTAAASKIAPILPGRYAVIGPEKTLFGFRTDMTPGSNSEEDKTRRILLTPDTDPEEKLQVQIFEDGVADNLPTANIQNPIAIAIDFPKRLSVTEPVPTEVTPGNWETYPLNDYNTTTGYGTVKDEPLDKSEGGYWGGTPGATFRLGKNETRAAAFIVHLQRLADPTQAYDPNTNPYMTLDKMPVDVTSFNGIVTDDASAAGLGINLFTRERGEKLALNRASRNLWSPDSVSDYRKDPLDTQKLIDKPTFPDTKHHFSDIFAHSLGFLNGSFRKNGDLPINSSTVIDSSTTPVKTLADRGMPSPSSYDGSPIGPFPWLNWNDRPYISKNELLLVPNTPPNRFLQCCNPIPGSTGGSTKLYTDIEGTTVLHGLVYPHLPNFFNSTKLPTTGGSSTAIELHRILDYVRVPSRFIKTNAPIMDIATPLDMETIREITDRREPGRVNLNTITSEVVFNALQPKGSLSSGFNWVGLQNSRWGQVINGAQDEMNVDYPSRVPNPFRSSTGLNLTPNTIMRESVARSGNATMLRQYGNNPLASGTVMSAFSRTMHNPYFRYQTLTRLGNIAGTRSNVYAVWVTVGYFEVEPVVFDDSNGYTDPNTGYPVDNILLCDEASFPTQSTAIYPDGVRLGQEVGADVGEVKRNRAFYMIDRSIPVGFMRGENLNVEDAILIKRTIE